VDGVLIEAQGGDRYRVNLPTGPVDVDGAEAAVRLAEGGLHALWDKSKHPRARGGRFGEKPGSAPTPKTRTVGSPALGNRRVVGTPKQEEERGARNARMAQKRSGAKDVPASKLKNRVAPERDVPGPPPKGEETKPEEPLGSPGRPVETDDVAQAAKELAAGRYVQLRSKNEVSTLLRELQREVQAATAKGDKAPDINLCKVTVKGTSLFCVESKGVPRVQMPQLKGDVTTVRAGSRASKLHVDGRGEVSIEKQFRDHLVRHGVNVEDGEELASHLKATQNELNGAKVAGIANSLDNGTVMEGALFVSKDNYVVDGHHRWAATIGVDYEDGKDDLKMPVQRIDMDIIDILLEANRFADEWGIPQAKMGDFSKKMLSGLDGAPPPLAEKEKKKVEEAARTPDGKWRARMPDGRRLDFASRELAESALGREWDKIKHPRARAGRFAETFNENFGLPASVRGGKAVTTPPLFSPGRADPRSQNFSRKPERGRWIDGGPVSSMGYQPTGGPPSKHYPGPGSKPRRGFTDEQWAALQSDKDYPFFASPGRAHASVPSVTSEPVNTKAFEPDALRGHSPERLSGLLRMADGKLVVASLNGEGPGGRLRSEWEPRAAAIRAEMDRRGTRAQNLADNVAAGNLGYLRSPGRAEGLVPRGGAAPFVGDRFYHAEHGDVEVVNRPDVGATDRPNRAWVRVVDSAGKEHLVRNDSLDQVAVRPSRRQALERKQASKRPRSPGRADNSIGVTEPTTQTGRDAQARQFIEDLGKHAAGMGEGEYHMKLGWLRRHGYAEGTGPWRESLTDKGRSVQLPRRVASPGTDAEYPRSPGRAR
jgi:hypothetical protein